MWYEYSQNNSGGRFIVNDKVCHRLFIEAKNEKEADFLAEELGCYWDGVENGSDCSCCGDRWSRAWGNVDLEKWQTEGYTVGVYGGIYGGKKATENRWNKLYGQFTIVKSPEWVQRYSSEEFSGSIAFKNIEEYAQFLADNYSWTKPDARIYYKDGRVVEIFGNKMK